MSEPEGLGDVPAPVMRAQLHRMADWVADYREGIERRPIVPRLRPGQVTAGFPSRMPERGMDISQVLDSLDQLVMPGIVHWGHPRFLGYFGSTSNGPALLGEIAAAALNVSAMTWKTSPAATELETVVLGWMRDLIGLPSGLFGVVYDTASVAVVHALAAARERALGDVRGEGLLGRPTAPVLRVYASDQAHSSVEKAMVLLGLGERNVVRIASDDAFRMDPSALRQVMRADRKRGLRPFAVVATVGSTSTASVDSVLELGGVCDEFDAWLHVDAAYGGAMGALPEGRWVMRGMERADSVAFNPHKWLFVPLDFSALYLRDPAILRHTFARTPEYLEGDASPAGADGEQAIDYMDYGVQLGRRFRALKAWMVLSTFGREGIVSRIREHCRLAAIVRELVEGTEGFELAAPVTMAVVCFRYCAAGMSAEDADAVNRRIVERINASGAAYLTYTSLRQRVCMRVGFGNMQTTEDHVTDVWRLILAEAERLSSSDNSPPTSATIS